MPRCRSRSARALAAVVMAPLLLTVGMSANAGQLTWEALPTPRASLADNLVTAQDGSAYVAGKESGVHRYDAASNVWTRLAPALPDTPRGLFAHGDALFALVDGWFIDDALYRSPSRGAPWERITRGVEGREVEWVGGVGDTLFAIASHALLRSDDLGVTWAPSPWRFETLPSAAVAYGAYLLVGTRTGEVLRTTDLGATWQSTAVAAPGRSGIVGDLVRSGNTVYARMGGSAYASGDFGRTWRERAGAVAGGPILGLTASDGGAVASTRNGVPYRYDTDVGRWRRIEHDLPIREIRDIVPGGGSLLALFEFADGRTDDVYRSDDGGETWRVASEGLPRGPAPVSAVVVVGDTLIAGTDKAGVYRSDDDGASWTQVDPRVTGANVTSLTRVGDVVLAGRDAAPVLRSADAGRTWEELSGSPADVGRFRQLGNALYAINGDVWATRNLGDTWSGIFEPYYPRDAQDIEIHNGALVVGASSGAHRSNTERTAWTRSGAASNFGELARVRDILYAGPGGGTQSPVRSVFRSVDGGLTWAAAGVGSVGLDISSLEAYGSTLYAGFVDDGLGPGGVRRSRDGGESWEWVRDGVAPSAVDKLLVEDESLYAYSTSKFSDDRRLFRARLGPPVMEPQLTIVYPERGARVAAGGSEVLRVKIHNHRGGWRWRLSAAEQWRVGGDDGAAQLDGLTPGTDHTLQVALVDAGGEPLSPPVGREISVTAVGASAPRVGDTLIAFVTERHGNAEIYTMAPDGSEPTNITQNRGEDTEPVWSPDGSRIAFVSDRSGSRDIYIMDADGANVERVTSDAAAETHVRWSPDGGRIAFIDGPPNLYTSSVVNVIDLGSRSRHTVAPAFGFSWSPDGSRFAVAYRLEDQHPSVDGVAVVDADGDNRVTLSERPFYGNSG